MLVFCTGGGVVPIIAATALIGYGIYRGLEHRYMVKNFDELERKKLNAARQYHKLKEYLAANNEEKIKGLIEEQAELEAVKVWLMKQRNLGKTLPPTIARLKEQTKVLQELHSIEDTIRDLKHQIADLEVKLKKEDELARETAEQLKAELESAKQFKQDAVEAGYEILKEEKLKEVMQEIPAIRHDFCKAVDGLNQLRRSVSVEQNEFEFVLEELEAEDPILRDQMKEMRDFEDSIKTIRETIRASDSYQSPGDNVPPKGASFSVVCERGVRHEGPWYHISNNSINNHTKRVGWEVEADGKGRYMCSDCLAPFDLVLKCEFSCDCAKGKYWKHHDHPERQKAERETTDEESIATRSR